MTASTLAGICRADRPVLHPLTADELAALNAALAADGVPVTAQIDGRPWRAATVTLWPSLAIDSRQMAHTLLLVCGRTDLPVRWAGAL
jgi:hypothetical protein